MDTFFSVIVPVYNVSSYLSECVESILNQPYNHFELILVDDGSKDKSGEMCDRYAQRDARVRVIHKSNGGLVSARIAGSELAQGDYICCVDGDDWVAPDYFNRLNAVIQESHPDILYFGYCTVNQDGKKAFKEKKNEGYYSKEDIIKQLHPDLLQNVQARYMSPSLCNKAIRAKIYKACQPAVDPRITIGEDAACSVPCILAASSIQIIHDSLYYYRRNDISMTIKKHSYHWDSLYALATHLREICNGQFDELTEQCDRYIEHAFFNFAVSQFYSGKSYHQNKACILDELRKPIYQEAIEKARFQGRREIELMDFCLKHNWIFPLWLYSRIR